jgi:N-acetylmuramoyl-L-alanine amidase
VKKLKHLSAGRTVVFSVILVGVIFGVTGFVLTGRSEPTPRSVCIDPGHSTGGPSSIIDPATGLDVADNRGEPGEVSANWELAQKVKARLERDGFKVRLTKKSEDSSVDLRKRAEIGNTCSLIVRLHCDVAMQAIFHPAAGRYKAHGVRRVNVDPVVARGSNRLALAMFPFLKKVGIRSVREEMGGNTDNRGTAYVVSVLSRVPVVLIENDPRMVSNNPAGQDRVADAVTRGIEAYFQAST